MECDKEDEQIHQQLQLEGVYREAIEVGIELQHDHTKPRNHKCN